MKTALTIAGSDSCGGAGIQADIKTMTLNGVFAMSVITALTAQNTVGVNGISEVSPAFLKQQLDAVFVDIFPDAVKIGMIPSSDSVKVIAECLNFYKAKNVVIDPVMISTSGTRIIDSNALTTLKTELLPIADIITPNIPETEILAEMAVRNEDEMLAAAKKISEAYGCAVLCKGGHRLKDANDLLYTNHNCIWFYGKRIDNPNTHGTGCTLSSAIAANLAKGFDTEQAVRLAKEYVSGAIAANLTLGSGNGPLNHAFDLTGKFAAYAKNRGAD